MSARFTTITGNRARGRQWLATPLGGWIDRAMRRRGLRTDAELLDLAAVCREALATLCSGGGQVATVRRLVDGLERLAPLTRKEMDELADAVLRPRKNKD